MARNQDAVRDMGCGEGYGIRDKGLRTQDTVRRLREAAAGGGSSSSAGGVLFRRVEGYNLNN